MKEVWETVKDFPYYKVSNLGKVKSINRTVICKNNKILNLKGRILKNCFDGRYYHVRLSKNNIKSIFTVHRLVLIHFGLLKSFSECQCNHIDGNKLNNKIENLEWVTPQENTKHAYAMGLAKGSHKPRLSGSNHPNSKLNEKDIKKIRKLYKTNKYTYEKISKIFNVHLSSISLIINRKIWKHV